MTGETKTPLTTLVAPYGRELRLHDVSFESGMHLLRLTVREGQRFTILDIDARTALGLAEALRGWAENQPEEPEDMKNTGSHGTSADLS